MIRFISNHLVHKPLLTDVNLNPIDFDRMWNFRIEEPTDVERVKLADEW